MFFHADIKSGILKAGPGVDSDSNRNECQIFPWGKARSARMANNLTATCEPIVYTMWDPRSLKNL
jgi:hypothetical protein